MKKLFLVAALGVAGLVSATEPTTEKESNSSKQENSKKVLRTCVQVMTSCGKRAVACGETTVEIVENAWLADELSCPTEPVDEEGGL